MFGRPSAILLQWTGLRDAYEQEWYHKDIGEFDNGDRFVIEREDWLAFYVDWIGCPKNMDQADHFCKIKKAKRLCSAYENPDLLD